MPQLQINQGPQDALLYDNTRSYFTNVGYVRTSNFQMELRDVDPQNTAQLGSTVQFVIPKAADLLGPCDLMVDFKNSTTTASNQYASWVEAVGYAMIERITFSVGSHDVETITGDHLNILNELMRTDVDRLGKKTILKTGRPSSYVQVTKGTTYSSSAVASGGGTPTITAGYTSSAACIKDTDGRRIFSGTDAHDGKKLIIPLGLFFTKHPSAYFPLAAIAGCNDVRIAIKFRTLNELLCLGRDDFNSMTALAKDTDGVTDIPETATSNRTVDGSSYATTVTVPTFSSGGPIDTCRLRCHYVHVTGPEATTLMNKEHVRLLKLWQNNNKILTSPANAVNGSWSIDLSMLHPVQELIITIRKKTDMSSSTSIKHLDESDQGALTKNYFAYHGSGTDPNIESFANRIASENQEATLKKDTVQVNSFKLTLNGQERHPSLAANGVDREYLMERLMPMLHSNTSETFTGMTGSTLVDGSEFDFQALGEMMDRKEIYVYPFALNPEGANPSGAVNFSKVSHAKLTIDVTGVGSAVDYQVDVYGLYYNWLQIKDGRALTSFA